MSNQLTLDQMLEQEAMRINELRLIDQDAYSREREDPITKRIIDELITDGLVLAGGRGKRALYTLTDKGKDKLAKARHH